MVDASLTFARRRPAFGPAERRRAGIVVLSVLFHVVLLAPLAMRFFEPALEVNPWSFDDPIFIEIEPRPLLPGKAVREPAAVSARTEATPALGDLRASRVIAPANTNQTEAPPSPPTPRIVDNAPSTAAVTAADAWQVTPETMRAAVARSLRLGAAGCRAMDGRLNAAEQRLCDDRFNEAAARAGPLGPRSLTPSEARRDAQFARDGAAALAAHEALRARRSGVGVSGASPECVGGNLRGTCAGAYLRPEYQHSEDAPFGGSAAPK